MVLVRCLICRKLDLSDWFTRQWLRSINIFRMFHTKTVLWRIALGVNLKYNLYLMNTETRQFVPVQEHRLQDQV